MSCVWIGIFHESEGQVKLPYIKTMNVFSSPDCSNMNLFLLLFHTTHNEITQLGIQQRLHNKRGS